MDGWHHGLNGHEFEQTSGDSEGQGSLVCCSPQGHKELDTTEATWQAHTHTSKSRFFPGTLTVTANLEGYQE